MLTVFADALLTALRRDRQSAKHDPWADRYVPRHLREAQDDASRRPNPYRDLRW